MTEAIQSNEFEINLSKKQDNLDKANELRNSSYLTNSAESKDFLGNTTGRKDGRTDDVSKARGDETRGAHQKDH